MIQTVRRTSAGIAVVCMLSLGLGTSAGWQAPLALVAVALAGVAALGAGFEAGLRPSAWSEDRRPRQWLLAAALVGGGAALAVQSWFRPGTAIAGGDIAPPDGTAWLGRMFTPWSQTNLGQPEALQVQLPWAVILRVVTGVGGNAAAAQRIWITILFAAAPLAGLVLFRAMGLRPVGAAAGAAIYALNPYVLSVVGTNTVYLAALVLLALLPALLLEAAKGRLRPVIAAALIATTAPLVGYAYRNPPLVGMIAVACGMTPLVAAWLGGSHAAWRAIRCGAFAIPLVALASAYWLAPAYAQLATVASKQLASTAGWTWTEGRATITNGLWLNTTWGWSYPEYYPFAGAYDVQPLQAVKFLLPAAVFSGLALQHGASSLRARLRLRLMAMAAIAAVFLIVLGTGTQPPGAPLFNLLYHLPMGWLLREPGRFLMLAALAYAVLGASAVDAIGDQVVSPAWRHRVYDARLQVSAAAIVAGLAALVSYPLVTGAVVPDRRPLLPSAHVVFPPYWYQMAGMIDRLPVGGAVLVLPPNDFYQMPYRWGYYGNDDFVPDLIQRPVVLPIAESYTPASVQLRDAVRTIGAAFVDGHPGVAEPMLAAMGISMVLVRGDVDPTFPRRSIDAPLAIERGIQHGPQLTLAGTAGPLQLFVLAHPPAPAKAGDPVVVVNTDSPDLRILADLPPATRLVSAPAQPALPRLIQLPRPQDWQLSGTVLSQTVATPPGWTYRTVYLDATGVEHAVTEIGGPDAPANRPAESPPYRVQTGDSLSAIAARLLGGPSAWPALYEANRALLRHGLRPGMLLNLPAAPGASAPQAPPPGPVRVAPREGGLTMSMDLGQPLLANGDFTAGASASVGDCYNVRGPVATHLSASVQQDQTPSHGATLRLSARGDSACVWQPVRWVSGPLFLSMRIRHLAGDAARICLWETDLRRCATTPDLPAGDGWQQYRAIVSPDQGTRSLQLYLYADGSSGATLIDYSDVSAFSVPPVDQVFVLGSATSTKPGRGLFATQSAYSDKWSGPRGATHVRVNGIFNGWFGGTSDAEPSYLPARVVLAGTIATVSLVSLAAVVLLALGSASIIRRLTKPSAAGVQRRSRPRRAWGATRTGPGQGD